MSDYELEDDFDEDAFAKVDAVIEQYVATQRAKGDEHVDKKRRIAPPAANGHAKEPLADSNNILIQDLQRKLEALSRETESARAEADSYRRRLTVKEGEISTIRRAKAQEEARHTQALKDAAEQIRQRDVEKKALQESFRKDIEQVKTATLFQRQEHESMLARKFANKARRTPTKVSPQHKTLAEQPSPTMQRTRSMPGIARAKKTSESIKGFNNSFIVPETADVKPRISDAVSQSDDVMMEVDDAAIDLEPLPIEIDVVEDVVQPAMRMQLNDALFGHKTIKGDTLLSTFYLIMHDPLPADVEQSYKSRKDTLCTDICAGLASSNDVNDEACLIAVGNGLAKIFELYLAIHHPSGLCLCMSLQAWLVGKIPDLALFYLGNPRFQNPANCDFIRLLSTVTSYSASFELDNTRVPPNDHDQRRAIDAASDASAPLALSELYGYLLRLLQSLNDSADDSSLPSLEYILAESTTLADVLSPQTSAGIIRAGLAWLLSLSTHINLFRSIIGTLFSTYKGSTSLIEHLACLCSFQSSETDLDYQVDCEINVLSITVLGLLCVQHQDGMALIAESTSLHGHLLVLLHRDTSTLYHSESVHCLDISPSLLIQRCSLALHLLHYLSAAPTSKENLRAHLYPSQMFPSIRQHFTLAIGRLACAEPPDWLPAENAAALLSLEDCSLSLLDFVLSPDEQEGLYAIFADVVEEDTSIPLQTEEADRNAFAETDD